ncbi:MAG: hypothetical protein HQ450_01855 [Alcaligenaceae bacterium]|nr:hypothetical protein [Alcaligenaceae bacterium]
MNQSNKTPSRQLEIADVEKILFSEVNEILSLTKDGTIEARVSQFVRLLESTPVQQNLNCCQTTAVAYALTAMGFPTSVDDIFWMVQVPVESAVRDGMTLAETFELATRYIHHAKLPVSVECHHFDELSSPKVEELWDACLADTIAGPREVLAFNFHSGIAHGWSTGGGGHFSVLLGTAGGFDVSKPGDIVVADVHPLKYGAYWSVPATQLLSAMMDMDSCGRARGMLRFRLTTKGPEVVEAPSPQVSPDLVPVHEALDMRSKANALKLPDGKLLKPSTLVDWTNPPEGHDRFLVRRFIPKAWGASHGVANMGGMSALTLAVNVTHGLRHEVADLDACMRALRCSYVDHLHEFQSSELILQVANRLVSSAIIEGHNELRVNRIDLGKSGDELRRALIKADISAANTAIILPLDINVAKGGAYVVLGNTEAAKLSHGAKMWAAIASINPNAATTDPHGVILSAVNHTSRDGRLWTTSFEMLSAATRKGEVQDGFAIALKLEHLGNQSQIDRLYHQLDQKNGNGEITTKKLCDAMVAMGLPMTEAGAAQLVAEFNRDGTGRGLSRDEFFEMINTIAGHHGDHEEGSPAHQMVAKFMKSNGCVPNELGFSTCHVALAISDIPRNVAFYNNILGWPLYKTVDRAHAGLGEDTYGSSWASYGAFASFIVFHLGANPVGSMDHGAWANPLNCPPQLLKDSKGGLAGSISFNDIPVVFLGVVLEPGFFDMQLSRIASLGPSVQWLEVTDVKDRFGGGEIDRAICFRDPDGYPLIFFVSTRSGTAYSVRHPAVPFVYSANFRLSADLKTDMALITRKISDDMRAQLVNDQLTMTKSFYQDVLGCRLLSEDQWNDRLRLEYEWEGHFVFLKSDPEHIPAPLREKTEHNMGGNKGVVPLPHFGPNSHYDDFAKVRKAFDDAMKNHHVPASDIWCLTRTGRAPPFNHIDGHNMLFPTDADSCLSMFLTDPSGNALEMKWYLDFGEMFHHHGEVGVGGLAIDNSMIAKHFPPAVLELMEQRALRGDAEGQLAVDEE